MNLEIRAFALRWKVDGVGGGARLIEICVVGFKTNRFSGRVFKGSYYYDFITACAYRVRFDYVAIPALHGNAASRAIVEKYFYAARHVYADSTVMPLLHVVSPDYSSVSNGYEGDYER